jgi:hypothetical protein
MVQTSVRKKDLVLLRACTVDLLGSSDTSGAGSQKGCLGLTWVAPARLFGKPPSACARPLLSESMSQALSQALHYPRRKKLSLRPMNG